MKPKVIVLNTGGTIGHRSIDGVAVMDFAAERLASDIGCAQVDLEFRALFRKGSMDIVPADWQTIATAVAEAAAARPRGVVILHGTDTMHYTASALSFMLRDLAIPIVITGSMMPGGDAGSDAILNLRDAVQVAAEGEFAEVCVVFSADAVRIKAVVIRGCRAKKVHSTAIDAFASINALPLGFVVGGTIERTTLPARPRSSAELRLALALDSDVVLIKLTPNLAPHALARCLQGSSGAVLEGTGVGHIRTDLQPIVSQFKKPVVITTQTGQGGERLGTYDVDRQILAIPNIIPTGDMSSDTALVKLMWVLGQCGEVKSIMPPDLAGEMQPDAPFW